MYRRVEGAVSRHCGGPGVRWTVCEGLRLTGTLGQPCRHLFKAKFPERYTYLILEMRDADDQNLIRIFPQSVPTFSPARVRVAADQAPIIQPADTASQHLRRTQQFIDHALTQGGRVLVHCGDGISRSPAVV